MRNATLVRKQSQEQFLAEKAGVLANALGGTIASSEMRVLKRKNGKGGTEEVWIKVVVKLEGRIEKKQMLNKINRALSGQTHSPTIIGSKVYVEYQTTY